MAARKAQPTKFLPNRICTPEQHILLSCHECKQPKVADMELFPFCSTTCRNKAGRKASTG